MGTLLQRRFFRVIAGICMLAVVYLVAWHAGYVQDLAARFGDDGPSPVQVQPDEHDTDPRPEDEVEPPGEDASTGHPWWVPPAIVDPDATATSPAPPARDAPTGTVEVTATTDHLDQLTVRGQDPKARYSRDAFGPAWSDEAGDFAWTRNGCDTRQDVLKRDLVQKRVKPGAPSCTVLTGVLPSDKYSGVKDYRFDATDGKYATDLDVEHEVALGDAWAAGAWRWDSTMRTAFANDPVNLLAVNPSLNRVKGDKNAAEWLPPNKAFHCQYIADQVRIKATYGLSVTLTEKKAMLRVLQSC